jgi:MscS family membrane protein
MEKLIENIEEMLRTDEGVHQDFFMVKFVDFAESSLTIFLYYFSKSIQWAEHLGVKQRVNLNLMRLVKEAGSSMAFPTRTIHIESDSDSSENLSSSFMKSTPEPAPGKPPISSN